MCSLFFWIPVTLFTSGSIPTESSDPTDLALATELSRERKHSRHCFIDFFSAVSLQSHLGSLSRPIIDGSLYLSIEEYDVEYNCGRKKSLNENKLPDTDPTT